MGRKGGNPLPQRGKGNDSKMQPNTNKRNQSFRFPFHFLITPKQTAHESIVTFTRYFSSTCSHNFLFFIFFIRKRNFICDKTVQEVPKRDYILRHISYNFPLFHVSKLTFGFVSPLTMHQLQKRHLISSPILRKSHSLWSNFTEFRHFHTTQTTHIHNPTSFFLVLPPPSRLAKLMNEVVNDHPWFHPVAAAPPTILSHKFNTSGH